MRLRSLALLASIASGCVSIQVSMPTPVPVAPPPTRYFCGYSLNPYTLQDGALAEPGNPTPFARFTNAHQAGVELKIPNGTKADRLRATFTSGWVTFNADYLPAKSLELRSRKELTLSPVLRWPIGGSVLIEGIDGKEFVVALERPEDLADGAPLRARLACEDTTIAYVPTRFEGEKEDDSSGSEQKQGPFYEAAAGALVPFSAEPRGPVLERLVPKGYAQSITVLATDGEWLKVRATAWPARLEGWVPRASLKEQKEEDRMSGIFGGLGVGSMGKGRGTPDHPRCGLAVPLLLRHGDRLVEIGRLNPHAAYVELAQVGDASEIRLPELDWIKLEPGYTWMLSASSLAQCRTPEEPAKGK